jgi:hypothetical protein
MAKTEPMQLQLPDGTSRQIEWVVSPIARNIRLSLTRHGLRLTTPRYVRRSVVESFLRQQAPWIQAQLGRHDDLPPNTMLYLGEKHRLEISDSHQLSADRVAPTADGRIVIQPVSYTVDSAFSQLERWLKSQASVFTTPLLIEYAQKMDVAVPALRFRDTTSRWGSCTHHGAITLNWRLVHTPLPVMRYVVIHELAHRVHLNHSSSFWELVNRFDGEHLVHRGWLKRHGHLCRTPEIVLP